jgi:hypothetical protein
MGSIDTAALTPPSAWDADTSPYERGGLLDQLGQM